MVNLIPIFQQMVDGVKVNDKRFDIIDQAHIIDLDAGIEYHLEKNQVYTITKGEEKAIVLTGNEMTAKEAEMLQYFASELPKLYADKQREKLYNLMYQIEDDEEEHKPLVQPSPPHPSRYVP